MSILCISAVGRPGFRVRSFISDDAVVVGVRRGVLFMCPIKEKISTLDEMYNTAGFYAKNNLSKR